MTAASLCAPTSLPSLQLVELSVEVQSSHAHKVLREFHIIRKRFWGVEGYCDGM